MVKNNLESIIMLSITNYALHKAIGQIKQWIRHEVFHHVEQKTSAYKLWTKLEEMYQAKTSRNKSLLIRKLVNLKLQRGLQWRNIQASSRI